MAYDPAAPATFDIEEARRVLRDVFAPWVQDLGLSIVEIESDPAIAHEDRNRGGLDLGED